MGMLGSIGKIGDFNANSMIGKAVGKITGSQGLAEMVSNPQGAITNKIIGALPTGMQNTIHGLAGMSSMASGGVDTFSPMGQLGTTDKAKEVSDDWMKKLGIGDYFGTSGDGNSLLPKNPLSEIKV